MWNPFKKKFSSKEINLAYEHMDSGQQKQYRDLALKFTPEKAMKALGVEKSSDRIPIVPEFTKERYCKAKKELLE